MILILEPDGTFIDTFTTLEAARTDTNVSGKTVVVTSALSETASNITARWPKDRILRFEKGGSIIPSTDFGFVDGACLQAGKFTIFGLSAGKIEGLNEVYPEWWGATNANDATWAINRAFECVRSDANPTADPYPEPPDDPVDPTFTTTGTRSNANGGVIHLSQLYMVSSVDFSSSSAIWDKPVRVQGIGPIASGFIGFDDSCIVVDTIGTNHLTLNDFSITGQGTIGLFRARSTAAQCCHNHRSYNLKIDGTFSIGSAVFLATESGADYEPWWGNRCNAATFITSPFNSLNILSTHGTVFESSNTDNRVYGGCIYNYQNGSITTRFIDSASYTFFSTMIACGEGENTILCQYELSGNTGNTFMGHINWHECLFEGGTPTQGASGCNPTVHFLKGRNYETCLFYHINSYGGYYNQTDPQAGSTIMTYDSAHPAVLFNSEFTKARFNNGSVPVIALYGAEECNIDLTSRADSVLVIATYQADSILKAETVNYGPVNSNTTPMSQGSGLPTSGKYAAGHIHWNTHAPSIQTGTLGWRCYESSSTQYPQGRWVTMSVA